MDGVTSNQTFWDVAEVRDSVSSYGFKIEVLPNNSMSDIDIFCSEYLIIDGTSNKLIFEKR